MRELLKSVTPQPLKRAARAWRPKPHTFEMSRYLWIREYIEHSAGFFVEAGANDGFNTSNTLYLEQRHAWTGLLIEPVPHLAEQARMNRPAAVVEQCALVPPEYSLPTVPLTYAGLMTVARGAMKDEAVERAHIEAALPHMTDGETPYGFDAPAMTLTQVLEKHRVPSVDFLSLDVEGYELQALQGLDFTKYQPTWMLIEARFRSEIDAFLLPRYRVVAETGDYDVLYQYRRVG